MNSAAFIAPALTSVWAQRYGACFNVASSDVVFANTGIFAAASVGAEHRLGRVGAVDDRERLLRLHVDRVGALGRLVVTGRRDEHEVDLPAVRLVRLECSNAANVSLNAFVTVPVLPVAWLTGLCPGCAPASCCSLGTSTTTSIESFVTPW